MQLATADVKSGTFIMKVTDSNGDILSAKLVK